jgi:hypothetical protein
MKNGKVSPEEFVRAWMTSTSLDQVCKKTHLARTVAQRRASQYRGRGINLPRKGSLPLDVFVLNKFIESLEGK